MNCIGNEDMLEDCRHHTIELNDGKNYEGSVAAVDCKGMHSCAGIVVCL